MTDKPEKAIDALHAELTEDQRAMGNMLHKSTEADDAADAPPMPEDLLDDVLSDLGVESRSASASRPEQAGLLERFLEVVRGKPLALAGLAAAACIVAIFAVNSGDSNDPSGVRGNGATISEPPVVVFVNATAEQKAVAEENFEAEHLRFSKNEGEAAATNRPRILVDSGQVQAFRSGEDEAFLEVDAPADPHELVDTISVLTQAFETEE